MNDHRATILEFPIRKSGCVVSPCETSLAERIDRLQEENYYLRCMLNAERAMRLQALDKKRSWLFRLFLMG